MIELEKHLETKRHDCLNTLNLAYDMESGGLAPHYLAVANLADRKELQGWMNLCVNGPTSNYLNIFYCDYWRKMPEGDDFAIRHSPYRLSPSSPNHLRLFDLMEEEYKKLFSSQVRLFLGGEKALATSNSEDLINEEEMLSLLTVAKKKGLITDMSLARLYPQMFEGELELDSAIINRFIDVPEPRDFLEKLEAIEFLPRFKEAMLRAAVHKLGCMLALTEQLTFDAKAMGIPVAADYRRGDLEHYQRKWQAYFGEPVFGIKELYRRAFAVFSATAEKSDPYVQHLLSIPELPHLVG